MTKNLFEATLSQYAMELGLSDVQHNDKYGVCLEFDQEIEICMRWDKEIDAVYAYAFCDYLPNGNKTTLFESFMKANFLWINTGGATLSIDKNTNSVYLIAIWEYDIYQSSDLLKHYIDSMVFHTEFWREQIKQSVVNTMDGIASSKILAIKKMQDNEASS